MQSSLFKVGRQSGMLEVLIFILKKKNYCTYQYIINTSSNFPYGTVIIITGANTCISSPETFTVIPVVVCILCCILCSLFLCMTEPYSFHQQKFYACDVKARVICHAGLQCGNTL